MPQPRRFDGLHVLGLVLAAAAAGGAPAAAAPAGGPSPVPLAVTLDDLPLVGVVGPGDTPEAATDRILAALRARRVPATGFVVCGRLGDGHLVRRWHEAGVPLGNHTTTHRDLDDVEAGAWEAEVDGCSRAIARVTRRPVRYLRFPMLHEGRSAPRHAAALATLRRLGLENAPVTVDTADWIIAREYGRALTRGDARLRAEAGAVYVDHVLAALRHYRQVARERVGREVPQILLLHANALAADHLPALLTALVAEGVRFVGLEEALRDPVYRQPDDYLGGIGMSRLYRLAPAQPAAWQWDRGQEHALEGRLGAPAPAAAWRLTADLTVRQLRPRLFIVVHERPFPSNSMVAEMADGTLVFVHTPVTPAAMAEVLGWLRVRFGARPLVAIDTHAHLDALGGNAALRRAGARVYASDATARLYRSREGALRREVLELMAAQPGGGAAFRDEPVAPPTDTFPAAAGLTLRFGDETVRVLFPGPSHAPDEVVVHFPSLRVLFGGCTVIGRDRLGNLADADRARWPAAIERLRGLDAAFVIPGHGDRTDPGLLEHTLRLVRGAPASAPR